MISNSIDAGNLTNCSEDAAGGLIAAIDSGASMNCADLSVSDDAEDGLIAAAIDSTYCAVTNVSDDAVNGLMMLMC